MGQSGHPSRLCGHAPPEPLRQPARGPLPAPLWLHDSQVPYWEPLKWLARLRAHSTGAGPFLLHTELEGGHLANPRTAELRAAPEYAFLLSLAGIRR